jgi:hypothetical protein
MSAGGLSRTQGGRTSALEKHAFGNSVVMYSVRGCAAQAAAEGNGFQPLHQMLDGYRAQLHQGLATVCVPPSLHRLRLCMRASMPVSRAA